MPSVQLTQLSNSDQGVTSQATVMTANSIQSISRYNFRLLPKKQMENENNHFLS